MIASILRRCATLVMFAAVLTSVSRATTYYGPTSINLNSLGPGGHTITASWAYLIGGNVYTYCTVNLAGYTANSNSHIGEADAYVILHNVHWTGSCWVADSVELGQGTETSYWGYYDFQIYWSTVATNVTLPSTIGSGGYGYYGSTYYPIITDVN